MKKILIAGVTSGSGKTTATLGVLSSLQKKYKIQSYKVGPDYVDTKFHTRITGRPTRNLDNFLIPDSQALEYLFSRDTDDIDLGIVEGVMGLYDGLGTDKDAYSTASIAKQLDIPVVLVINAKSTSTSAAAIINGFVDFDPEVDIRGVIINNLMSDNHYQLVKGAIERYSKVKVLGYIPRNASMALPSRQLGLVPDDELDQVDEKIEMIGDEIAQHVDLDQLVSLADENETMGESPIRLPKCRLKLGIAEDEAFNFYYSDNLRLLKELGVELVEFSPIRDQTLPNVDALYIGGGYPEEFGPQLASNHSMKDAVMAFSLANKPIYAECGGLMYLGKELETDEGTYEMVGVFNGKSKMTPRLKKFGYCIAHLNVDTVLAPAGERIVGHEFHHSVFTPYDEDQKPVMTLQKERDQEVVDTWSGGYQARQTFASYLHVHFYQSPQLVENLLTNLGADW